MKLDGRIQKDKKYFGINLHLGLRTDKETDWTRINFLMEIQRYGLLSKLPLFTFPLKKHELPFVKSKLNGLIKRIDFKIFLGELAGANLPEAKKLLFLARYGFFLKRFDKGWYWKCYKLLNDILLKIEASCPSFKFEKIDFEIISKENYKQKGSLLKEMASLYRFNYRSPVSPSGLVKRSLRGDDVNEFNEIFYRITSFAGLCFISVGTAIGAVFRNFLGIYLAGLGAYVGFYLWAQGYFKSYKLYRGKPPAVHEFASLKNIEKRFAESKACYVVVAKISEKPVGFFFSSSHLHLVKQWPRIAESGGSFTLSEVQGKGITSLATIMMLRQAEKHKEAVDYILDLPTTFHPIITLISEAMDFKPLGLEIGGLRDYYGYYSENCQRVDYANFVIMAKDHLGSGIFQKHNFKLFVLEKYSGLIKQILKNLNAKRKIVKVKQNSAEQPFGSQKEFSKELQKLKQSESAGLLIDLTEETAGQKMHQAEKNNFYFCGILPAAFDGNKYSDYAYYRYLSEERTVYPFISLYGFGIPDKGRLKSKLKKIVTKSFNDARKKNKLVQSFDNPPHWSN